MAFSADDHRHMAHALRLAAHGLYTTDPNPRVGCVLVRGGRVVGEGWHQRAGDAHAEVLALRQAGAQARGATAYVSLEPCCHHGRTPPCVEALIEAGIARVVAAMRDPNPAVAGGGLQRLEAAGILTAAGLLSEQAEALNPGFVQRMRTGRPFVRSKLAASLDGRTAMASGESRWITGEAARRDVQHLRARSSAILTGVGTVLADDPRLNVRLAEAGPQPLRVILDSGLRTPPQAQLLREPGRTLILGCAPEPTRRAALEAAGAEVLDLPALDGRLDLGAVLDLLGQRAVNELLVEAGPTLNGALMQAGQVDELVLYLAPVLMGDAARALFSLPGLERMADRLALTVRDVRPVGADLRVTAVPHRSRSDEV